MNENITNILFFIFAVIVILGVANLNKDKIKTNHRTVGSQNIKINSTTSNNELIFRNVIHFIQSNDVFFRYGKNKVEKDYQQDLEHKLALLKERFGYNIFYEATEGKHRIDFTIDHIIGIEMKVYRGGTQVEKELFYQITKYGEIYPKIIGLVLVPTDIVGDNQKIKSDIENALKNQNVLNKNDYEIIVKSIGCYSK